MWTDLVRSLKTVLLRCVSPSHGLTVTACHTKLAIYRDRHAGKGYTTLASKVGSPFFAAHSGQFKNMDISHIKVLLHS